MKTTSYMNSHSRYVSGGITDTNSIGLGWWEGKQMPRSYDDIVYEITPKLEGRPDLISYSVYGSTQYMWVVLYYNNIIDPERELRAGTNVVLPTKQRLIGSLIK